jgi:hypothetical protein
VGLLLLLLMTGSGACAGAHAGVAPAGRHRFDRSASPLRSSATRSAPAAGEAASAAAIAVPLVLDASCIA